MLPLLRPILRRPPHLRLKLSNPVLPLRLQRHNHGPHKEYFQDPSQFPSHAYQTNIPPPEQRFRAIQHDQTTADLNASTTPRPPPKRPSLLRRLLRSTLIVSVFLTLGTIAGTAVITWDYIQPPFEPGSEQEQELVDEIDEILETSTLIQTLQEAGFQEDSSQGALNSSQNLVTGTLNNVHGFKTRFFRHAESKQVSVMVFFAGFGIEGWPDTVHGGAITSIMAEAAERHFAPEFASGKLEALPSEQYLQVNFRVPVRPAEIYAVLVHEQGINFRQQESDTNAGSTEGSGPGEFISAHEIMTYLISSETMLPDFVDGIAAMKLPPGQKEAQLEAPGPGKMMVVTPTRGNLSLLTLPDSATLHATVELDVNIRNKHVVRQEGEDNVAYFMRWREDMLRRVGMAIDAETGEKTWLK